MPGAQANNTSYNPFDDEAEVIKADSSMPEIPSSEEVYQQNYQSYYNESVENHQQHNCGQEMYD